MTILFLAYTKDDASCANQLRQELEAKSYTVEREPDYYDPGSRSYQQLIENAIVGLRCRSAGVEQPGGKERRGRAAMALRTAAQKNLVGGSTRCNAAPRFATGHHDHSHSYYSYQFSPRHRHQPGPLYGHRCSACSPPQFPPAAKH